MNRSAWPNSFAAIAIPLLTLAAAFAAEPPVSLSGGAPAPPVASPSPPPLQPQPDATPRPATHAARRPPPIPPQGPTARPKSLRQVGIPLELTQSVIPADNPQTPAKIGLGQRLFFEGRLSVDGTVACASCHDPHRAFTDGQPTSVGIGGRTGQRNAPTVLNALYNKTQFWDGRAPTLEAQAALPITNPFEMGQPTVDAAVASLAKDGTYRDAFQSVFGHPPNAADLLRALASYERAQIAYDSPFDHFVAGDARAIGDDARRGWQLFNGRGQCNKCHALSVQTPDPTNFTDNDFHNIGIGILRHHVTEQAKRALQDLASGNMKAVDQAAILSDQSVLGRFLLTKKPEDIAAFKTPNIRNVLVTAPYFHDGSQETLWDVVDHYNKGDGLQNPWLDADIQPLALSEHDIDDLVAFLASLTSPDYADLGRAELARQSALAQERRPQRDTARAFGPKPVQPKPPPL
jgi:cytochrome c peroxidase